MSRRATFFIVLQGKGHLDDDGVSGSTYLHYLPSLTYPATVFAMTFSHAALFSGVYPAEILRAHAVMCCRA
ncbi:hypothetical protein HMPREF9056_00497 [Actinomyces sp. oral taxon 170 str. F0386]|nr:hypothetical protein HMPREF9056_00497 [Actinomyces sp. oral taxon 170 str. F0386]